MEFLSREGDGERETSGIMAKREVEDLVSDVMENLKDKGYFQLHQSSGTLHTLLNPPSIR
ncbi:unnamed protein product [Darwinula stevensoni]|uniref:Uncharacterized protein n=1 Tax=Darwinula stevensoni TaxID=69355 RepID=A0A7R8X9Y7_9CRUS|nr:unnamed protein product [Darwinula stevensoni]CAG0886116.1 unnamed protein product [Darwinula stevensoni]